MNVKKMMSVALGTMSVFALGHSVMAINGAGASFPAPCYQKWIAEYSKVKGEKINYQSVGSGAGLAQIKAKTVNFGASDEPLTLDVLDKDGMIQFPMLMGGIVAIVNIPGVRPGQLKLTADLFADIYLGKVKNWGDGRIAAVNEGLSLPDEDIIVVHRADASGTTWNFTNYLTKLSKDWEAGPGCGKEVAWPVGIGGMTNAGVAQLVKKCKFSIGYVESGYAFANNLTHTQLQNAAGKFVQPTARTFSMAAAHADWDNAPGLYMVLTDQPGDESWPIVAPTYILIHKEQTNAVAAKKMLSFFDWAYDNGDATAEKLGYVPMPKNVVAIVRELWKKSIVSGGTPVWQ